MLIREKLSVDKISYYFVFVIFVVFVVIVRLSMEKTGELISVVVQ